MKQEQDLFDVATEGREIRISRTYAAPRELVFQAWTAPEHVAAWWGPSGFTITTYEMDVRPGGVWKYMMHGPDGTDYPNKIVYEEVVVPEKLAYLHGTWDDEDEHGRFQAEVTFVEEDGKTRLTMRSIFASADIRETVAREYGAVEGGKQTLERLARFVESQSIG